MQRHNDYIGFTDEFGNEIAETLSDETDASYTGES